MDAGLNLSMIYQAGPVIWGSLQDLTGLQSVYKAGPFFLVNPPQGAKYVYDSLGRLSQVVFTNQTSIVFSYDAAGNRTSIVTTCGPSGC